MQGPLPYLTFNGVEVSNAARTVEYLRNGLANTMQGHWEVGPASGICSVLYRVSGPFSNPASDPAPWYDASEAGATDFLGFVLLSLSGYGGLQTRQTQARNDAFGGSVLGARRRDQRTWKFRGAMVSASDIGAEYGGRWLESVLGGDECDCCDGGALSVRLACPPASGSNDASGEWFSYDTVLIDGPTEVDQRGPSQTASLQDTLGGCRDFVIVEFTMVSGNPYLYKRSSRALTGATIAG